MMYENIDFKSFPETKHLWIESSKGKQEAKSPSVTTGPNSFIRIEPLPKKTTSHSAMDANASAMQLPSDISISRFV